ncbi:GNAT family N-acetyltransferase [Natronorarus salvus]|uniref:GNAT family N-acetyltransferase n=1 Tax=Natronorarus salvus TaxID=3117733 RepID=UPI002F264208
MDVERVDMAEWRRLLPDRGVEVFHTPAALSVVEEYATGELQLLAARRGEQPVGLFAAVVRETPLGSAVLSPPPGLGIPRLGPVLTPTSPKQRKRERAAERFAEGVIEHFGVDSPRTLFRVHCTPEYPDPRPFAWAGFDVGHAFTYALDVTAPLEDIRAGFSKSLRREIDDADDLGIEVTREAGEVARAIYEDTAARYEARGDTLALGWEYVRDLLSALGDRARVYVARTPEGAYLGGITVLYGPDRAYFWQGGVAESYEGTGVNGSIHWRIVADLATDPELEGVETYDLVGANTRRLCRYKAKFSAPLVAYPTVESNGVAMALAKRTYGLVS